MRRFVRHPTDIPLHVRPMPMAGGHLSQGSMLNVCDGGLSCEVNQEIAIGTQVEIRIPVVSPSYQGQGVVVWCNRQDDHFEIGVSFADMEEAFKSRMVEQICQIEHYKRWVLEHEGRKLDGNQAAAEWIAKYAADFN